MKGKIKNLFAFMGRAWVGGIWGKGGVILAVFSASMFIGIFWGDVNVQRFVLNIWQLNREQALLAAETARLETYRRHIQLLQDYSPDYVEELGLKYLNIGDKNTRILKI